MRFKDIALPYAQMDIKVFPLAPRDKIPALGEKWKDICTTDPEQIARWDLENPDYNCALVAEPNGICVLEFDIRGGMKAAAAEMGREVPKTRAHISGKQRGHFIFLNTDRSRAMGNKKASLPDFCNDPDCEKVGMIHKHEWFSFRADFMYVVGPGSIHPNGKPYKVAIGGDVATLPVPDWICDFVEKHSNEETKKSRHGMVPVVDDFDFDDLMDHYAIGTFGGENCWYTTEVCPVAGYRHQHSVHTGFYWDGSFLGWKCFAQGCPGSSMTIGGVLKHLNETHEPYPEQIWPERDSTIDIDFLGTDEESAADVEPEIAEKDVRPNPPTKSIFLPNVLSPGELQDQSDQKAGIKYPELRFPYESLPSGRFKNLVDHACQGGLSPGLVVPAIMTLASAIPIYHKMEGARINLYFCLLAMVGAGKDTAIGRAKDILGLETHRNLYTAYTPSGERSIASLLGDHAPKRGETNRRPGPKRHCIITFELEDTIAKSRGETSSVLTALQWLYDNNDKTFSDSRRDEQQLVDCRLSWLTALPVGDTEIDEESFRLVFDKRSTHGLLSRFLFGFAEERFDRRRTRNWAPPIKQSIVTTQHVEGLGEIPTEELSSLVDELTRSRVEGFAPTVEKQYENWDPIKDWSGRDTYHVLKIAIITALLNGHKLIEQADWDFTLAFMAWQGKIRSVFQPGRADDDKYARFNERVIKTIKRYTEKEVAKGADPANCYFRWRGISHSNEWWRAGVDVEKAIKQMVDAGALQYRLDPDFDERGKEKKDANKKYVRLA